MATLLTKLRHLIFTARKPPQGVEINAAPDLETAESSISLSPETTQRILRLLEWTQEEELTCEETFALLDEYVELADGDADTIMPLVKHHLDGCPDCFEGYDALRRILQNDADTI